MDFDLPFRQDVAYRFDSLYQWLSRKYHLKQVALTIEGEKYCYFEITNTDEILESILQNSSRPDEEAPYWTEMWSSALALSQFIGREVDLQAKKVLELGCGLGVVSLIAHRHGADVVVSDIEEDSLRMSEINWIINFMELPQLRILDWRKPELDQKFDILLASDVIYEKRLFWPFMNTINELLTTAGQLYLSEPDREISKPFFQMLQSENFQYEQFNEIVKNRDNREVKVSIYKIWKK